MKVVEEFGEEPGVIEVRQVSDRDMIVLENERVEGMASSALLESSLTSSMSCTTTLEEAIKEHDELFQEVEDDTTASESEMMSLSRNGNSVVRIVTPSSTVQTPPEGSDTSAETVHNEYDTSLSIELNEPVLSAFMSHPTSNTLFDKLLQRSDIDFEIAELRQLLSGSRRPCMSSTANFGLEDIIGIGSDEEKPEEAEVAEVNETDSEKPREERIRDEVFLERRNIAIPHPQDVSGNNLQGDIEEKQMVIIKHIKDEHSAIEELKTKNQHARQTVSIMNDLIDANENDMAKRSFRIMKLTLQWLWFAVVKQARTVHIWIKTHVVVCENCAQGALMAAISLMVAALQIWLADNGHLTLLGLVSLLTVMICTGNY